MANEKDQCPIDKTNIQGSIWPRLPKYYESYLFYKITKPAEFLKHLKPFIDSITTGKQCEDLLGEIKKLKDEKIEKLEKLEMFEQFMGVDKKHIKKLKKTRDMRDLLDELIAFGAVNIAFSQKGMEKLNQEHLNDDMFRKGMYTDLILEGADDPERLLPEFKPPPEHKETDGDDWRVDLVFIVAAESEKSLNMKIADLETAFHVRDQNNTGLELVVAKHGQRRPGGDRGKEHFGFEDHISQPQIKGLDPDPKEGEPLACPPGYIFIGHEGDPKISKNPTWSKDGSYLVFRQLDQKVPEFENFVAEKSRTIPNYDKGDDGKKLAAHMMGRWKSGAPVALTPDTDNEALAFRNDFDYRPKQSMLGCPFAAHTRKVRPRADHKPDIGTEQDPVAGKFTEPVNGKVEAVGVEYDSDDEPDQKPAEEDASVILRRGITFGPEVGEDEKKGTIRDRGIYFTCYQSDIRDGFNIIMIRWASNSVFPTSKEKTYPDEYDLNSKTLEEKEETGEQMGPGMDPFINQRLGKKYKNGHISLYGGKKTEEEEEPKKTTPLDLGVSRWVDQRGGEYFFTPSIEALHHFTANF